MVATLNTTVIQNAGTSVTNMTLDAVGNVAVGGMPYGATSFLRNKIINGNMAVDQRNSGASQIITAAAALAYTVDRWYAYCTGANVTGQQVQGATANQYRYQFTGAASVTGIGFGQRIEAANCADLAGTTATLSVVLSNSFLTTVTWTAYYANTTNTFGTLASPTVTQIATGTFSVNSTATTYSTNISIPSAATTGIQILFTVGAQTTGTWVIGNVQLEPGSVATPFERPLISKQLADCQRYYQVGNFPIMRNFTGTTISVSTPVSFPVTMRIAPSVTASTGTLETIYVNAISSYQASIASGASTATATYTASAEL
jgi:hypothetical protein